MTIHASGAARANPSNETANPAGSNLPTAYLEHGIHAVRLFNLSTQTKNSGMARALYALYLAMRHEVILAADVAAYMRSTERKGKTAYLNRVLDTVFNFDHDNKKVAEPKTRTMIGQCLIPALFLFQSIKYPPATMIDSNGNAVIDPEAETVDFEVKDRDKATERGFLVIPGRLLFKADDKRGDAVAGRDELRVKITGIGGATYDQLFARAREHLMPDTPNTGEGAQDANDIRGKMVKEVSLGALIKEVTKQVASVGAKDRTMLEACIPDMKALQAQMVHTMPISSGLSDEDVDRVGVLDEAINLASNGKYLAGEPAILARLARLYDALDELTKDDNLWAKMNEAKNA